MSQSDKDGRHDFDFFFGRWRSHNRRPGHMDPPVEGRFTNGLGEFLCDDVLNGVPAKVRYQWADVSTETPRWEQAFSWDEGRTWKTNWVATFTREG